MRVSVVVLASFLALGAQSDQETDNIREATFRYMFAKNASGQQQAAKVYCLSVEDQDPADDFMHRFANDTPPVKKASQCTASAREGVRDKETGARGLAFRVDKLTKKEDSRAEVDGGYYEAGLSASGNTYSLEKKEGVWKVVKDVMHWIS